MRAIEFAIPGEPVAWARARSSGARRFTAPAQRAYMRTIQYCARDRWADPPSLRPFSLGVTAVLSVPESWPRWKQDAAIEGLIVPCGTPDTDNYAKIVCDALNGIIWSDDAQVIAIEARKLYGTHPSLIVSLTEIGGRAPSSVSSRAEYARYVSGAA